MEMGFRENADDDCKLKVNWRVAHTEAGKQEGT